jgi:hypothetical protein
MFRAALKSIGQYIFISLLIVVLLFWAFSISDDMNSYFIYFLLQD